MYVLIDGVYVEIPALAGCRGLPNWRSRIGGMRSQCVSSRETLSRSNLLVRKPVNTRV